MAVIISIDKVSALSKNLEKQGKKIVLAGGCFDILHPGHVIFLEKAKKAGDILMVLLESDEKVRELKGVNRPVHSQKERAKVLAALRYVDYIILLPFMIDREYDQLVARLEPDVIAATSGEAKNSHLKRSAKLSGAKFKLVTSIIGNYSTSKILNH